MWRNTERSSIATFTIRPVVEQTVPIWVIVSDGRWHRPDYYHSDLIARVDRECRHVPLPKDSTLVAFDCASQTPPAAAQAHRHPAEMPAR